MHSDEGRQEAAAPTKAKDESMPGKDLEREPERLEKAMVDAAKILEFERAAELRDSCSSSRKRCSACRSP